MLLRFHQLTMLEEGGLKMVVMNPLNDNLRTNELMTPYRFCLINPSANFRVVTALFLSFTPGTGGMMTPHSTREMNRWLYTPQIHVEHSDAKNTEYSGAKNVDTRSPADLVATIRDGFAISMSDLAAVLGVSRPTAYAWLEGQEPKPEAMMRIQGLSRAADEFSRANITRLDKLVHRPILDGRSLLDLLKADEDPLLALSKLREIGEKEALTRRESKGSGKHLRSLDDVSSESSVGIYERS
jgi:DNA-binding transcriptional regulator YiaG